MRDGQGNHIHFPAFHLFSVVLMIVMLTMAATQACVDDRPAESYAGNILAGEHQLRKMIGVAPSESNGSFFLFVGSFSQSEALKVSFAWKMRDGTFAISTLPIEKIRVKINNAVTIPTIKFRWTMSDQEDIQWIIGEHVLYAVITCKDSDWPQDIQLPLQKRVPTGLFFCIKARLTFL